MEEKMQACSLEPAEDLVARIEMEKQPTVNKPPQTLSEDLDTIQQQWLSPLFSIVISATCICVGEVACTIVPEILSQDTIYWGIDTPTDKSGLSRILPTYVLTLARCLWRNLLSLYLFFFLSSFSTFLSFFFFHFSSLHALSSSVIP